MILPKKVLPTNYQSKQINLTPQIKVLPFYIKSYGFSNEKRFVVGNTNAFDDILLLYVVSGTVRYTYYETTNYIGENHLVISACNTPLIFVKTSKDWSFFYLILSGTSAKFYYNMIRNTTTIFRIEPLSDILNHFIDIYDLHIAGKDSDQIHTSLYLHEILYYLYVVSQKNIAAKNTTPVQEAVVQTAKTYIEKHYREDLTIEVVCKQVGVSEYHFCRLFKKYTGMTLHQYITEFRIEQAKTLLTHSKLSIKSVGEFVGFENPLTFSRCFDKSMHMTPTAYRKYF